MSTYHFSKAVFCGSVTLLLLACGVGSVARSTSQASTDSAQVRLVSHRESETFSIEETLAQDELAFQVYLEILDRLDTSEDGAVCPVDALLVIEALNRWADSEAESFGELAKGDPLDVNLDRQLAPSDALMIVNWLNASDEQRYRYVMKMTTMGGG